MGLAEIKFCVYFLFVVGLYKTIGGSVMSFRVDSKVLPEYVLLQEEYIEIEVCPDIVIIEERNNDMKLLEKELEVLLQTNHVLASMVEEQGEKLEKADDSVIHVNENIEVTVKNIEVVAEKTSKKRRTGIFASIGGASGASVGALGFMFGPIIGIGTTLVALGVGALAGVIISKK